MIMENYVTSKSYRRKCPKTAREASTYLYWLSTYLYWQFTSKQLDQEKEVTNVKDYELRVLRL